jgi:hypothetical protein
VKAPSIDPIERDFEEALARLQDGQPLNGKLKIILKKKGVLKITSTNVALEAGHSRTLIAMTNCRYPRIRELIALSKGDASILPSTHSAVINELRARLAEKNVQLQIYKATATAHSLARKKAEDEAAAERSAKARLLKNLESAPKVIDFPSRK